MSPTLLELAVAVILLLAAWQLGLALAPIVIRQLRALRQSLDEASDEALADQQRWETDKEDTHDRQR